MNGAFLRLLVGVAVLGAACSKKAPPPAGLTLPAPPAELPIKLDAELGGALELLGAKLEPATGLKPGSRVELTLYWRKRDDVESGFRLFTHVLDESGERILNLDSVGPLRTLAAGVPAPAPSEWATDLVYVDKQAFTVPLALRTDSITLVAGLFHDAERIPVTRGKKLGERALVAKVPVTRASMAATSVPVMWVPRRRTGSPIVIDGDLGEGAWLGTATTGHLVNAANGEPPTGADVAGVVKVVFDDEHLYVGFDAVDEDLRGGFDPNQVDPPLWTRDTVEVMIDPDGDGDNRDYYELQIGPQNLVFDSFFDSYNTPKVEPNGPFGHQEWSSRVKSAVRLRGTLDDAKDDEGYVVEMAIPWSSFDRAKRAPPKPEDVWRMNFYVMQNNGGAAWSPILGQGNFHRATRFGRVRFSR